MSESNHVDRGSSTGARSKWKRVDLSDLRPYRDEGGDSVAPNSRAGQSPHKSAGSSARQESTKFLTISAEEAAKRVGRMLGTDPSQEQDTEAASEDHSARTGKHHYGRWKDRPRLKKNKQKKTASASSEEECGEWDPDEWEVDREKTERYILQFYPKGSRYRDGKDGKRQLFIALDPDDTVPENWDDEEPDEEPE